MTFYTGDLFPGMAGNLFIATMSPLFGSKVIRLVLNETPLGMRVVGEEWLLADLDGCGFASQAGTGRRALRDERRAHAGGRQDLPDRAEVAEWFSRAPTSRAFDDWAALAQSRSC